MSNDIIPISECKIRALIIVSAIYRLGFQPQTIIYRPCGSV